MKKTTLLSGLAAAGLVAAAATAGVAAVVADPAAPPVQAAPGLSTFEDCTALQAWYVDHTLGQVGPYGWKARAWTSLRQPTTADPAQDATSTGAVPNGPSGTNTQEAGVDEPDVAKTDGRLVVRLLGRRLVVTDVSGSVPRELADWEPPGRSRADGLLLVEDHVLLVGGHGHTGTEVLDVDLADPSSPVLADRRAWAGRQLSLRAYAGTVRLVTGLGLPELPFVEARPGGLNLEQAKERNQEIVRASTAEDWAPGVACTDVFHPRTDARTGTVAVSTFRPGALQSASAVAVTGAGDQVYSSTSRLYVAETQATALSARRPRAQIHAFALRGETTDYVASGMVAGTVRDRWSLDEHDGHLRVAVSWPARAGTARDNGIVVLDERGDRLVQVGELRGLGRDEELKSVRWFDDLAVVVTFREIDPVYTIELSEPTRPRQLGELKIPGFSSYLHPIGGDRLLGLGADAGTDGVARGAQASVLDLRDRTRPSQQGKLSLGPDTWLNAVDDPHAFTWLPDADAAITTLTGPDTTSDGNTMVLLRVSPSGTLSVAPLRSVGGWEQRALPLQDGRVALVGDEVRVVVIGR